MFKKYIVTFFFITYLPFVYGFDGTRKFLGYTLGTIIPKTTVKFVGDLKKRVQGNPYNQLILQNTCPQRYLFQASPLV